MSKAVGPVRVARYHGRVETAGLSAGEVLEGPRGRYRIDAEHGRGGFGITYRATREADGLPVIVKILRLSSATGWKAVELFEREAAVLRGLSHPGIPGFLDDVTPATAVAGKAGAGNFALVMELIPGVTLRTASQPPGLSRAQMHAWLGDVLEILAFIHGRSPPLVHRDVNPKNIILRPDGRAALVDFGTVQAALRAGGEIATTSAGTFGYAPMEQFLGQASPVSDLYGLGMTYLAVASGREPEKLPLRGIKVDVAGVLSDDPRLVRLIDGLVEPDPRARVASATEALGLLSPLRPSVSSTALATPPASTDNGEQTFLRVLAGRLSARGFTVERGGERGRTPLSFHAIRPPSNLADEAIHIYAAAASALEGGNAELPLPPVATTLFVQSVANEHPVGGGLLRRLLNDRSIVVPLLASAHGLAPRTRAHLEQSLREPSHLTAIPALIDTRDKTVDLVVPRSLLPGDPDDRIGRVRRALGEE